MSDLAFLPAAGMAQQIREKKVSPVELAEAHLARGECRRSDDDWHSGMNSAFLLFRAADPAV